MKIGSLILKSSAILSPMEGVSCVGFRSLCFENGAGLTFTEMVRSAAISRENAATLDLIDTYDPTVATGLQLLAKSPQELLDSLRTIERLAQNSRWNHFKNICAVDINLGCPSPEVINIGAGPALLKRTSRLCNLFSALSDWKKNNSLGSIGAVGCKIRLGLNASEQEDKIYLRVIDAANQAGLDYITVHGRHAGARSRDAPTWSAIGEIKSAANMPVFGNGNIFTAEDARRMQEETQCDGFMLARAAIKNPWIFNSFRGDSIKEAADANHEKLKSSRNEAYPTVEQVDAATAAYRAAAVKWNIKGKFEGFHITNFKRMRHAAATGDRSLRFEVPKTMHLS